MRALGTALLMIAAAEAWAVEGVTFYLSFDRWMLPEIAAGSRAPLRVVGQPQLAPGKIGQALALDGRSYLEFPAGANVGRRGGTVALWFRPTHWGAKTYDNIFGFSDNVDNALHFERAHPSGQFRLVFGGPNVKTTPRERSLFSSEPLRDGEWVHLAATWDHERQRAEMWINGRLVAAFEEPGPLPLDPPSLLIGCGFGRLTRAIEGLIDELVILDHAASAEEMRALQEGLLAGRRLTTIGEQSLETSIDHETGRITIAAGQEGVPQLAIGPAYVAAQIGERVFTPVRFEPATEAPAIAPRLGPAEHRVFTARDAESGALLRLHIQRQRTQPVALLWLELFNPTTETLLVRRLDLLQTEGAQAVGFGGPLERLRIFLDSGWSTKSGSRALALPKSEHTAGGALIVTDPQANWAASCSFVSFQTAGVLTILRTGETGAPEAFSARCYYPNSYRVRPGQALQSEIFAIAYYPTAAPPGAGHAALAGWADLVMDVNNFEPPRFCPSGWNSWYGYRLTITEELVLENARVIKEKLPGLGLENIQVDHGWQYKNIVGHWIPNERFPHGLPWLAEQLREMGFTLGLWTAVTHVSEFAPLFQEHPEAMFQTLEGKPQPSPDDWFWEPHGKTYALDPTHPIGAAFYRQIGETIRSYGCRYWKNDFQGNLLRTDALLHDREATYGPPIYLQAVRLYREGAGPQMAHMACNGALNLIAGLCDVAWTHGDIGNPAGNWAWLRGFWRDFNCRAHVSGKFYWSDPDYLQVGQGTPQENRVRMAFVVFGGGPMFLGDRLPELPPEKIELIKQCLPAYGPTATPLDIFTYKEYPQVSHLPVKTDWGQWHLLGLFNLDEQPQKIAVELWQLGLAEGEEYLLWDYFGRRLRGRVRALGETELVLRVPVPATDVVVLRLTPMQSQPFVIGTDLHLAQGAVELQNVRWDKKTLTLSGEATRPPGTKGNVYLYVPPGYVPADGPALGAERVWAVPLEFTAPKIQWRVRFKRG